LGCIPHLHPSGIYYEFLKDKREQIARLFGAAQIMAQKGCWEAVAEYCETIANIAFNKKKIGKNMPMN
jgi:hypothetical protein